MNLLQSFEKSTVEALVQKRPVPEFSAGDTIKVNVRIIEGAVERTQAYEGVCIARKNAGLNSSFTVRKISHGEGVERIFPLYSPRIESIQVVRRGDVRRAKLYYLRERSGKSARIREKMDFTLQEGETTAKEKRIKARAEAKKAGGTVSKKSKASKDAPKTATGS